MYELLWSAFLAFVFQVNLGNRSDFGSLLDTFIAILMMLILEPLWLHLFGTTLGKAIFGLRIEASDGRRLSYGEGLERTWGLIGTGMGYNIPIYNLIRLWKSYKLCSEKKMLPWDESISYTLKDLKRRRFVFYVGSYLAGFAILFTIMSAQYLPPHRGDLTVAEYVENHNYYAKFLGIDFGNEYLNENGKWAEKEFDGSVYIDIFHTETPEYQYTAEDGYVTAISFAVEIKDSHDHVGSYNKHMLLTSLAMVGAQKEMGLFSNIPRRIAEQIVNNTFKDFNFKEAGITFICDMEYSGYVKVNDLDLLVENGMEPYFNLKFTLNK